MKDENNAVNVLIVTFESLTFPVFHFPLRKSNQLLLVFKVHSRSMHYATVYVQQSVL